jgi:aspartate kinase
VGDPLGYYVLSQATTALTSSYVRFAMPFPAQKIEIVNDEPSGANQVLVSLNGTDLDAWELITAEAGSSGLKAVAAKGGIIVIHIRSSRMLLAYGFLRKVFEVFEKYRTPIDMITTSEVAVSVTIDQAQHLKEIIRELEPFGQVDVEHAQAIVALVGNQIHETTDILGRLFNALKGIPVRMVSYGGSPHNISLLVPEQDTHTVLQRINHELFGL